MKRASYRTPLEVFSMRYSLVAFALNYYLVGHYRKILTNSIFSIFVYKERFERRYHDKWPLYSHFEG